MKGDWIFNRPNYCVDKGEYFSDSIHEFDKKMKAIEDNTDRLAENLKPRVIGVFKKDDSHKTLEEVYKDFDRLIDYWG